MKSIWNKAKTAPLIRAIAFTVLAIAFGSFGYGWHRIVSAQEAVSNPNQDEAQAVSNGLIIFQRGFGAASDIPFSQGGQLYKVDPTTGSETLFGAGSHPNYSFDGTKVAFIDNVSLFFASSSDYSTAKGLVVHGGGSPENGLYPKLSPDNNVVAYQSFNGTPPYKVTIISVGCTSGNEHNSALCNSTRLDDSGTSSNIHPAWSPTLTTAGANKTGTIVFVKTASSESDIDLVNAVGDIYTTSVTIAPNGVVTEGASTKLTTSAGKYSFPTYSYDGTKIAFVKREANGSDSLYVMNAISGSIPTTILSSNNGQIIVRQPAWSPDGKKIAYSDSNQIFQITTDTFQITPVTLPNHAQADLFPSWAPGSGNPSPSPSPSPSPTPTLTFNGRLRDRVSRQDGSAGLNVDGDPDGTFTMTLPPATFLKSITKIVLNGPDGDVWDTIPNNTPWTVGVSRSLDGPFENASDGSLNKPPDNVPVGNTGVFKLFASAALPDVFTQGSGFTAIVTFSDASTATATVTLTQTAAVDLSIVNLSTNPTPSATEKENITYQVRVVNNGTELATGVKLTHQFVSYEVYDSGGVTNNNGSVGTCTPDNAKVVCTAINLGPGEDVTFGIRVSFRKASDPNAGHAAFTASSIQSDKNANDNSGQITVSLGTLPRPSNDDIANAVTIVGATGNTTGNNFGGTRQSDLNINGIHNSEPNHAGQFGDSSVWYKWVAPSNGPVDFFTTTTTFNTLLAVYTFETAYFANVVSNDDAAPGVTWSKVHFDAVANKTYYIALDGFLGAVGPLSLSWNHTPVQPGVTPATVTAICSGDKTGVKTGDIPPPCDPQHNSADIANVCTSDSDPSSMCQQYVDLGGFTLLTVKGTGFTSNSQVIIRGGVLKGFDNNGNPMSGSTTFINDTTLLAHIPPNPPLKLADLATIQVLTFLSSATATVALEAATIGDIPTGTYSLAANVALLNVIELKNATIPVGKSQTVCGNVPGLNKLGEETCIFLTNVSDAPSRTVTPTWFRIVAYCDRLNLTNEQCYKYGGGQAGLNQLMEAAFAINPQQPITGGLITVNQKFPIPTGADLVKLGALVIAQGGGNIIAAGGGNIIAAGGGNLVSTNGGNLIAAGGGNVIANDGATVIAQGGGNIIAAGGGNLIAAGGGNVVAKGYGNSARAEDTVQSFAVTPPIISAADLQKGSQGWFVVSSGGGSSPTVDVTTNLDGTVTGTLHVTFDQTSSPRIQDLQGLVFTVVANPAVVKLVSSNIAVNEGDGHAIVALTRTGDTTTTVSVNYATADATATERTDFLPVYGAVTFNPGETQKTITIPLIDNGYGTGSGTQRSLNLMIVNAVGGAIQMPNIATITINNNDPADLAINPLDNADAQFFVRQQYLDLLGREPSSSEIASGASQITACGSDQLCAKTKRTDLSYSLFQQYEQSAAFAFRLYRAAFGNNQPFPDTSILDPTESKKLPGYSTFLPDIVQLLGGSNPAQFRLALSADFSDRSAFLARYPVTLSGPEFVDAVIATVKNATGVDLVGQRNALINEFNSGGRSQVIYRLADDNAQTNPINNQAFVAEEMNRAFVATLYFGSLRHDPDSLFVSRLQTLNQNSNYRGLVDAFVNLTDYRTRFGISAPLWEAVVLTASQTEIKTWTIGGRTYAYLKLSFPNAGYRVANWGQVTQSGNSFSADALIETFSGPSVQAVTTTAGIYDLGVLAPGSYNFTFKNSGTIVKTVAFTVAAPPFPANPIDDARQFVKQQYRDFLNREADQAGEDFWTDNITKCSDPARRPVGQTVEQCTLRQRETTSGAFFLSPEFQYTGYYVLRMYQGALGRQPKLSEFLPDAQFVGNGIVVNGQLSAAKINQNRADFAAQFVNCTDAAKYRCSEFKAIYDGLTNQQYVDKLFQTTGVNASAADRTALVNGLNANPATETRASVLQKIVDGTIVVGEGNQQFTTTYGHAFYDQQFTQAFVQLEYFGYMKRDPDEAGYAFWLAKLNQFGGDFVNAEMVLAFISSPEYRARFGQP